MQPSQLSAVVPALCTQQRSMAPAGLLPGSCFPVEAGLPPRLPGRDGFTRTVVHRARCVQGSEGARHPRLTTSRDSSPRPTRAMSCEANSKGRPQPGKWELRMYHSPEEEEEERSSRAGWGWVGLGEG